MKYKIITITKSSIITSTQVAETASQACNKANKIYKGSFSVITENGELKSNTLVCLLNLRAAKISYN